MTSKVFVSHVPLQYLSRVIRHFTISANTNQRLWSRSTPHWRHDRLFSATCPVRSECRLHSGAVNQESETSPNWVWLSQHIR